MFEACCPALRGRKMVRLLVEGFEESEGTDCLLRVLSRMLILWTDRTRQDASVMRMAGWLDARKEAGLQGGSAT